MHVTQRRFSVLTGSVLLLGLVLISSASADTTSPPTGSCERSYAVATPRTVSCSFTVSSDSNSYSGWTTTSWATPTNANALEIDINGEPQPLKTCVVVNGGCATTTAGEDLPAGTVISCTLHAVTGSGSFACESDEYNTA